MGKDNDNFTANLLSLMVGLVLNFNFQIFITNNFRQENINEFCRTLIATPLT